MLSVVCLSAVLGREIKRVVVARYFDVQMELIGIARGYLITSVHVQGMRAPLWLHSLRCVVSRRV